MPQTAFAVGVELVVSGGVLTGSFAVPMKRIRDWQWEHIWFVYSLTAMILIPWAMAFATVPALLHLYRTQPAGDLTMMALLGLGWGLGSLFYGLAVDYVGIALSFALILGLTAATGSVLPLLVAHRSQLLTARGALLLGGVVITLAGITLCALAGYWREGQSEPAAAGAPNSVSEPPAQPAGHTASQRRFLTGVLICIASGLLSPMLNFAFAGGDRLRAAAVAAGAQPSNAVNPIWALVLSGGFLVNGGYCLWRMARRKNLNALAGRRSPLHWLLAALMGLLWVGGILSYGMGASRMGALAAEMGWPILMSTSIIAATLWGIASGEWKYAAPRSWFTMLTGIAVLTAAMFVIARA